MPRSGLLIDQGQLAASYLERPFLPLETASNYQVGLAAKLGMAAANLPIDLSSLRLAYCISAILQVRAWPITTPNCRQLSAECAILRHAYIDVQAPDALGFPVY